MIDRVMVRKYVGQSSLLFSALALALFAFAWVRVWVVKLLDMGQFQTILEQFREFEKFSPVEFDALFTYTGRVGMTFDEPIVILCTVIWCVSRGSDVVSGELNRGTLEMLLAQPISRARLMLSHAAVSVVGLALLALAVWGGIAAGVYATTLEETVAPPTFRVPFLQWELPLAADPPAVERVPMRERVDVLVFAASVFHLFAFGFFLLGLSTMLSAIDRYRWRTIGGVVTVYVLQLVMFGLGKAADSLAWLQNLTFFTCYQPQRMTSLVSQQGLAAPWSLSQPLADGLPPLFYPLILLGLGLLAYGVAFWHFGKRDLPAPL